ncbi:putative membrane protein mmpS4 [Mycobacterium marinum]|nr:transmembrane protein, MmpS5_2 [Mycobacterium liflandii 128FXT]MBC9865339.1 hypothetical protein [Mycobacterium pseudoshottsii]RFZ44492.1 putative membrane protein mmpS4 [Mycobacterium marinum]RFZ56104.1 putative membrane protein mmpS4 [Mycobacterium marinum]RFZ58996.1 putative membrane protein mmpS4 [Mycobacterium marinum]
MPSYLMTLWKTMTSRLAARPMRRLSGPAILLAIGVGVAATCGVANADPFQQVRYEVSGPGVAEFVSYQTAKGQQRATNINLPWSSEFTAFGGQVFVLSAQGQGSITCRILVDGSVVTEQTGTGTPGHTVCTH